MIELRLLPFFAAFALRFLRCVSCTNLVIVLNAYRCESEYQGMLDGEERGPYLFDALTALCTTFDVTRESFLPDPFLRFLSRHFPLLSRPFIRTDYISLVPYDQDHQIFFPPTFEVVQPTLQVVETLVRGQRETQEGTTCTSVVGTSDRSE